MIGYNYNTDNSFFYRMEYNFHRKKNKLECLTIYLYFLLFYLFSPKLCPELDISIIINTFVVKLGSSTNMKNLNEFSTIPVV